MTLIIGILWLGSIVGTVIATRKYGAKAEKEVREELAEAKSELDGYRTKIAEYISPDAGKAGKGV